MKNLLLTLLHLAIAAARLCGPGGVLAVIAENLVLCDNSIDVATRPRGSKT
jgi:hypothetical protein